MHARLCVVSANSTRSYRDSSLSSSSHSTEKGRRHIRQVCNHSDDETSTRSDDSLGTVVPGSRRYAQVGVTPSTYRECGTITTRRLHVAFDNKHQIWHLVSPEAPLAFREKRGTSSHQPGDDSVTPAGEHDRGHADDNDNVEHRTGGNGLQEIQAVTLNPTVMASSSDTNPNLTTMKTKLTDKGVVQRLQWARGDTTAEFTPTQSRGSRERRQSAESSQRDAEGGRTKEDMAVTPTIIVSGVLNAVPSKSNSAEIHGQPGNVTRDLTRPEEEAGSERSLNHGKKGIILYDCGVEEKAAAVADGGHTTRAKQDARGVIVHAVDGPQRQDESSDKNHAGTSQTNLAAIGGKGGRNEQSDGGSGDSAANPVSLGDRCELDVGKTWLGCKASVGFPVGRWGSAIAESSGNGTVRMASGSLADPSSGRLRATWRGDAVNLDKPIFIILKETQIGQPLPEENNGRNPDRKGFLCKKSCWDSADEKFPSSASEALDGYCDSAKFSSSEALDRPAVSRDDASGLRVAVRGAERDVVREKRYVDTCRRRGTVSKRDRLPRTRNIVLTENEALPVFPSERTKSPANARACASGTARGETCSHAFPLPLYLLPEPYIGPPIADFPRTWPSGACLLAECSEPEFEGETRNTDCRRGRRGDSRSSGREMRGHRNERSTSSERCSRADFDSDSHGAQSEVKKEARGKGETRNTDCLRGRRGDSRSSGREMRGHRNERSTSSERCSRADFNSDSHGAQSELKKEARGKGSGPKWK